MKYGVKNHACSRP